MSRLEKLRQKIENSVVSKNLLKKVKMGRKNQEKYWENKSTINFH